MRPVPPSVALLASLLAHATAHASPEIQKGPWLMDARPDSIAVLVELTEPGPVELIVRSTGGADPLLLSSSIDDLHEIVVEGLSPATRYEYAVRVGEETSADGSFQTAPPAGEGPVRFLVVGDNRTDAIAHAAVIGAMLDHPAEMLINTGDMVGHGDDPAHWESFFDVAEPLLRVTPMFPTLGNHELYPWGAGLPSFLRYTRVPREHGGEETYYAFDWGPVRFLVLDSNDDWTVPDGAQREWVEATLDAARDDATVEHLVVALHHGPLSSGPHGGHEAMRETGLDELFRRHRVSLVLSGHDHTYERGDADGLKYVVSGGGGAPLYAMNSRQPGQLAFQPVYHFVSVEVEGPRITVVPVRADGTQIERCAFDSGGPWECEGAPADAPGAGPVGGDAPLAESSMGASLGCVGAIAMGVAGLSFLLWRSSRAREG